MGGELILVVVVLGLVDNHCASKDRVGSVHGDLTVSILVLGTSVETGLNLLDVTNTAIMDVIMRVTLDRSEWVEDVTGGVATVLKITELVDLQGVKTRCEVFESALDVYVITIWLLGEGEGTLGIRVSKEIELADSVYWLGLSVDVGVVRINSSSVGAEEIKRALSARSHPDGGVDVIVWQDLGGVVTLSSL